MNATFQDVESYLVDFKACPQPSVVRTEIETREEEDRGGTRFTVVSGFHDDRYFYELRLDCGVDWQNGRTASGDAQKAALAATERIATGCVEKNVEHRRGRWCRPE